ncbi:MAG TPA: hypothetical protein PKE45_23525, partial [Caldilineaceae bacterium]|nr:hypothetical protein [Caldilineaceae bacterium]
ERELLARSLALPLIDHLLGQAVERYGIGTDKSPLLDGWRLWQLWDSGLPLSTWRHDIVHWVYVELPASAPGQPVRLPQAYTALCAMHEVWMIRPAQIQIPLLCAPLDQTNEYLSSRLARTPPTQLPPLSAPIVADEQADAQGRTRPVRHPGEAVALATVIEYVAASAGREQLPRLVAALGQYDSWETLAPALFDRPAADFEAGWQTFLSEQTAGQ